MMATFEQSSLITKTKQKLLNNILPVQTSTMQIVRMVVLTAKRQLRW